MTSIGQQNALRRPQRRKAHSAQQQKERIKNRGMKDNSFTEPKEDRGSHPEKSKERELRQTFSLTVGFNIH